MNWIISAFFLLISSIAFAQTDDEKLTWTEFKDKVNVGGNFGLGFSQNSAFSPPLKIFTVEASPLFAYELTERLHAGPGAIFRYYSVNGNSFFHTGPRVFGQFFIFKNLFAYTEYQYLNMSYLFENQVTGELDHIKVNVQSTFVGGGYRTYVGRSGAFDLLVLFNLTDNTFSPYRNPEIRIGFNVGL